MNNETKRGISTEARTVLNALAIRAVELAQRANHEASAAIRCKVCAALDEIAGRVQEARREIGR